MIKLNKTISKIKSVCGDNLIAVMSVGSVARKNYIKGWSDCDLIIVVKKLVGGQMVKLGLIGDLGITIVTLDDLKKRNLPTKVGRTIKFNLTEIIYAKDALPKIPKSFMSGDLKTEFIYTFDLLKNCLVRGLTKESAQKSIKLSFILLKIVAEHEGKNLKVHADCIKFAQTKGLDYAVYENLLRYRNNWSNIKDYKTIAEQSLNISQKLYDYAKKLF